MIYKRVVDELKNNKKIRLEGKDIAIPWLNLPKLSTVIPGVQKGRYIIVTANSKVGKTQIADYLFLYEPLNYIFSEANKGGLKLKIFYFSLEMSKEDKILQMISNTVGPVRLPAFINLFSAILPGFSPERATLNVLERLQKLGIPTGPGPDGSDNIMNQFIKSLISGIDSEENENGKVQTSVSLPPPFGLISTFGKKL